MRHLRRTAFLSRFLRFQLALAAVILPLALGCSKPVEEIRPADKAAADRLPEVVPAESDWPWWRGPSRDNHAAGPLLPVEFSPTKNCLWQAEIPGLGHASPVAWGQQVFIATADNDRETQSLICLDRATGQEQWTREIHRGGFMRMHGKNSHASATPACDGQRVFTVFMVDGGLWATAVDLAGEIVWQQKAGDFRSQHGFGSSPVIHQSLLIVAGDTSAGGFLTALDRETGDVVWKTRRGDGHSYGTPVLAEIAGKEMLLFSGQNSTTAYDPDLGTPLWTCEGPANTTANTVAWNDDLVFSSGGYPQQQFLAIRPDGNGAKVVWKEEFKAYVPSPLVIGDRVLAITDNGVAYCLAADSGKLAWKQRLDGGDFTASPILIGDTVFAANESGTVFAFRVSPKFELLAENSLDDGIFASPVICGGQLFIRTAHRLFCFSATEARPDRENSPPSIGSEQAR